MVGQWNYAHVIVLQLYFTKISRDQGMGEIKVLLVRASKISKVISVSIVFSISSGWVSPGDDCLPDLVVYTWLDFCCRVYPRVPSKLVNKCDQLSTTCSHFIGSYELGDAGWILDKYWPMLHECWLFTGQSLTECYLSTCQGFINVDCMSTIRMLAEGQLMLADCGVMPSD